MPRTSPVSASASSCGTTPKPAPSSSSSDAVGPAWGASPPRRSSRGADSDRACSVRSSVRGVASPGSCVVPDSSLPPRRRPRRRGFLRSPSASSSFRGSAACGFAIAGSAGASGSAERAPNTTSGESFGAGAAGAAAVCSSAAADLRRRGARFFCCGSAVPSPCAGCASGSGTFAPAALRGLRAGGLLGGSLSKMSAPKLLMFEGS